LQYLESLNWLSLSRCIAFVSYLIAKCRDIKTLDLNKGKFSGEGKKTTIFLRVISQNGNRSQGAQLLKVEVLSRKILESLLSTNNESKQKTGCLSSDFSWWNVKSRTEWDRCNSKFAL